jgi:hypothetical protein
MMRTHREHIGNKEKRKITPPTNPHKEKTGPLMNACMLSLLIGCMRFLYPNPIRVTSTGCPADLLGAIMDPSQTVLSDLLGIDHKVRTLTIV